MSIVPPSRVQGAVGGGEQVGRNPHPVADSRFTYKTNSACHSLEGLYGRDKCTEMLWQDDYKWHAHDIDWQGQPRPRRSGMCHPDSSSDYSVLSQIDIRQAPDRATLRREESDLRCYTSLLMHCMRCCAPVHESTPIRSSNLRSSPNLSWQPGELRVVARTCQCRAQGPS